MRLESFRLSSVINKIAFYRRNFELFRDDFFNLTQKKGRDRVHLDASLRWIRNAEAAGGGISLAWSLQRGWLEAYPETTGYIISTLVDYYQLNQDESYLKKAIELGDWEIGIQLPEGAVRVVYPDNFISDVFDTGMVLLGFTSLYQATRLERFKSAAEMAGDWLLQVQDMDGKWSNFSYHWIPHVYHSKVSWALYKLFLLTGHPKYKRSADENLKWIRSNKLPNNWFNFMAFSAHEDPFTHTIAYTLQGFLEIYKLMPKDEQLAFDLYPVTKSICDTIIQNFNLDKSSSPDMQLLPATLNCNWEKSADYACLTGNAQFAIVLLDLFLLSLEKKYYDAARNLIATLKMAQKLALDENNPLYGAIPGSYPIWGKYHPFEYPNWGPKFFADALMLKIKIDMENGFEE